MTGKSSEPPHIRQRSQELAGFPLARQETISQIGGAGIHRKLRQSIDDRQPAAVG